MTRPILLSAMALAACGPQPVPAQLVRTCSDWVAIYQRGQDRFIEGWFVARLPIAPGADLDAICEGYRR